MRQQMFKNPEILFQSGDFRHPVSDTSSRAQDWARASDNTVYHLKVKCESLFVVARAWQGHGYILNLLLITEKLPRRRQMLGISEPKDVTTTSQPLTIKLETTADF